MMIIRETLDLWLQNRESLLVPMEVHHKIDAGNPDAVGVGVDRREDIEQVLDIYVLRRDPLRCFEVGYAWMNPD